MYCYACGAKVIDKSAMFCYKCGAKVIDKYTEWDFEELWYETNSFYKIAKHMLLSSKKYRYVFVLLSVMSSSVTILSVLIANFSNIIQHAINLLKSDSVGIDSLVLLNQTEAAFKDVWCSIFFILICACACILSCIMLLYIGYVKKRRSARDHLKS